MRLLQLDSLVTSYTDARPEGGLFVQPISTHGYLQREPI
jgi:hypothetical protein